jgi:hypothetical protein
MRLNLITIDGKFQILPLVRSIADPMRHAIEQARSVVVAAPRYAGLPVMAELMDLAAKRYQGYQFPPPVYLAPQTPAEAVQAEMTRLSVTRLGDVISRALITRS